MNPLSLQESAALGSPSARQLLAQIDAETRQAKKAKEEAARQAAETAHAERAKLLNSIHDQTTALLAEYAQHALAATAALVALGELQRRLPPGAPSTFPAHLRRVHLPPPALGPVDPLYPTFTSVEAELMGRGL